jgi:predicted kinase
VLFSIEERTRATHLRSLVGISVVLDFPGNTKVQREWFRKMVERVNVEHELHFVDASELVQESASQAKCGVSCWYALDPGRGL